MLVLIYFWKAARALHFTVFCVSFEG